MTTVRVALAMGLFTLSFAGWKGSPGEASFDFFSEFSPASTRATAEAGVAHLTGYSAWYTNPALVFPAPGALQLDLTNDNFGGKNGTVSGTLTLDSLTFRAAIGASLLGAVEEVDNRERLTGQTHHPRSTLLLTGVAWRSLNWDLGFSVGLATDRIVEEGETALGWWIDAGFRYTVSKRISLGGALRRFGARITEYRDGGSTRGELPAEVAIGGSWKLDRRGRWILLTDWICPAFGSSSGALGIEWQPHPWVAVRGGTRIDGEQAKWVIDRVVGDGEREWRPERQELFGAGVSMTPDRWGIDYGLTALRDGAGLRHTIGLRYRL